VLPNDFSAIQLYSLESVKSTQVTDGMSDAVNPVFDKGGKYLYFAASTNSGESLGIDIHALARSSTSSVYLVVLDKDAPSPFAPESDEEKAVAEEKKAADAASGAAKSGDAVKTAAAVTKVDLDGIDQRILAVPMPARRYVGLQAGKAGTLLALEMASATGGPEGPPPLTVHRYDLNTRKSDAPLSGLSDFQMSFGGEKALYKQGDNWKIAALPPMPGPGAAPPPPAAPGGPGAPGSGVLNLASVEVRVDPAQEWNQMYREAWRIERDWFYDRNIHGFDLAAGQK
jgi:tricorn protease